MTSFSALEGPHVCHARRCGVMLPPDIYMCPSHWGMVSAETRRRIWKHYKASQEGGKPATQDWLDATRDAQEAVERKEFEICIQNHGADCGCWKDLRQAAVGAEPNGAP